MTRAYIQRRSLLFFPLNMNRFRGLAQFLGSIPPWAFHRHSESATLRAQHLGNIAIPISYGPSLSPAWKRTCWMAAKSRDNGDGGSGEGSPGARRRVVGGGRCRWRLSPEIEWWRPIWEEPFLPQNELDGSRTTYRVEAAAVYCS
jgi:hypothetical protein